MAERAQSYPIYDNGGKRAVSREMRAIGKRTHNLWESKLMKEPRWFIKNGIATFQDPAPLNPEVIGFYKDLPEVKPLRRNIITREDLANEQPLSLEAYRVTKRFKMVEDHLPDFMGSATGLFWDDWGASESYWQWGMEERVHSAMAAMILEAKGIATKDEMEDAYYDQRENIWVAPHDTARKMLIYANCQEKMTMAAYEMLAVHARSQGAYFAERLFRQTGNDEGRHHVGYNELTKVRFDFDPEGTRNDVKEVVANFTMPAEQFIPEEDQLDALRDLRSLGYRREKMGEKVLLPAVISLGVLTPEESRLAVSENRFYGSGIAKRKVFSVPDGFPHTSKNN